eukprot:4553733-Prymnesium_polylepis.1
MMTARPTILRAACRPVAHRASRLLSSRLSSSAQLSPPAALPLPQLVQIERSADSPVATLKLARPPANTLSLEFMSEIRSAVRELEGDPSVRGMVLASSNPKIFSAGLDLKELVDPDP